MKRIGGCAKDAPPVGIGLKPPADLLKDCAELPPVPGNDGDKSARTAYYAVSRDLYASCRDNNHGLKRYAETVSKEHTR